ncbi:hypothetical protein SDJN02_14295 [Cucurbita argyrosperma subsp. argyrosperma]|nr:hypothetical protein SDJN02_14295 [Cucurbita argyrosperma subsp. argyrosperma]
MPSSASAPASPPSASHSQNSATQPSPRKHLADAATNNDGLFDADEKKPDLLDQFEYDPFLFFLSVFDLKFSFAFEVEIGTVSMSQQFQLQFLSLRDLLDGFPSDLDFDNFNSIEKYKKYEADYAQRLMAKYFSKKNLYGGNIYEENTTIDDEIIKSSRWPCTRSFADPLQGFEDHRSSCSTSTMEIHGTISNGKNAVKKSG